MNRSNLTQYDEYPREMLIYLRNYGPHFNRKLYEFAVSNMTQLVKGKEQPVTPYTREETNQILSGYGVEVKNAQLYDAAYVASMCRADFLGSSIIDEHHVALYIKDVLDDVDAPDGLVFNRWYADMCYCGIPVNWEDML
jgi:hypothetical protein